VVCANVSKVWAEGTKRAHVALRDVDLDATPGEFIVLLRVPQAAARAFCSYLIAGLTGNLGARSGRSGIASPVRRPSAA